MLQIYYYTYVVENTKTFHFDVNVVKASPPLYFIENTQFESIKRSLDLVYNSFELN